MKGDRYRTGRRKGVEKWLETRDGWLKNQEDWRKSREGGKPEGPRRITGLRGGNGGDKEYRRKRNGRIREEEVREDARWYGLAERGGRIGRSLREAHKATGRV